MLQLNNLILLFLIIELMFGRYCLSWLIIFEVRSFDRTGIPIPSSFGGSDIGFLFMSE